MCTDNGTRHSLRTSGVCADEAFPVDDGVTNSVPKLVLSGVSIATTGLSPGVLASLGSGEGFSPILSVWNRDMRFVESVFGSRPRQSIKNGTQTWIQQYTSRL